MLATHNVSLEKLALKTGRQLIASQRLKQRLPSGSPSFDQPMKGGLPLGEASEWGLPLGCGGREFLLQFLVGACGLDCGQPKPVLWVFRQGDLSPYPPALAARGIDLNWIYFCGSDHPLKQLKPVFLEPAMVLVILDNPPKFTSEEQAFVADRIRDQNQHLFLIRSQFLSTSKGNIWAKYRFNLQLGPEQGPFQNRPYSRASPKTHKMPAYPEGKI